MHHLSKKVLWGALCILIALTDPGRAQEAAEQSADAGAGLYYGANALYNRKLYTLAIGEYKTFLERHPTHAKANAAIYGLALSYYSLQKHAEAEPLLTKAIAAGTVGDPGRLRVLRGQCLLALDRPAEAASAFDAVNKSPDAGAMKTLALAGLAEARFKQEQWAASIAAADALIATEPGDAMLIRGLYQASYARHRSEDYKAAIPLLERLIKQAGDGALKQQAAFLLGECYRETGALDKAAEHYAGAVGLKGAEHEITYRLGYVHFVQARYEKAYAAFHASLKHSADSSYADSARIYIGRTQIAQKKHNEAIQWLSPLSAHAGTGDEASLWLARAQSDSGDTTAAAQTLNGALTRFPKSPLIRALRFDLANALIANGAFKDAEPLLRALAADAAWTQKDDAQRLHAVCLHHSGKFAASLAQTDAFLRSYKDDPNTGDLLFLRAENLFLLNKLTEALPAYTGFLTAHEAHAQAAAAQVRVARIHHRQSQWKDALESAAPLLKRSLPAGLRDDLHFVVADARFRLEQWAPAIEMLDLFLKQAPANDTRRDTALIEQGIARLQTDDTAGARVAFQNLVKTYPKSAHRPAALSELGRIHYDAGHLDKARAALEACLAAKPDTALRATCTYTLGWVALAEKKSDEAIKQFQWITASAPRHPLAVDATLQVGLLQLADGAYAEAAVTLQAFLNAHAKHAEAATAQYSLGVALARSKAWQNAGTHLARFVTAHPTSPYADRALYEWAWCEKELKRPAEAAKRYTTLLDSYPDSALAAKVRTELAELSFAAKNYGAVIAELEKTLPTLKDPGLREQTLYRLGTAYFNTTNFAKSASTFDALVKAFPQSDLIGSARLQAGESRLKLGETVAARGHFKALVDAKPNAQVMESALLRLGEAQSLTKQWGEASTSYDTFLKSYPKSAWIRRVRFGRAFALEKQAQFEAALTAYEAVPNSGKRDELATRTRFQIGECLFALKRYDEAVKTFIRVTVDSRDTEWTAKALLETGRALEAKGDTPRAMDQFREVIQKYPKHEVGVVARQRLDALRKTL